MKKNIKFKNIIFLLTIVILFMMPNHIVWGGQNFQTVPTIGPSNTPTRTKILSETQTTSTKTPSETKTATKSKTSPTFPTITPTVKATLINRSKTAETRFTKTDLAPVSSLEPGTTMDVILPIISNEGNQGEQPVQDESATMPAFVFPAVVVMLFMIIYLTTRFLINKTFEDKSKQNNP